MFPTPSGAWYLSTHELVETALRDVETFRTDLSVHSGLRRREQIPAEQLFLSEIEEPRHGQIRRLFNATFGPQRLAGYEPIVRAGCERLVAAWADDAVVDLHGDYAARIPGLVMARIMGLPDDIVDRFDAWSRDGTIMARPCSPQFGEGRHPLQNELASELARRRALPAMPDDVFRRLAEADIGGAPLTDQEIVTQLHFMIQAGVHTTRGLLTHLVNRLLRDRDIARAVAGRPHPRRRVRRGVAASRRARATHHAALHPRRDASATSSSRPATGSRWGSHRRTATSACIETATTSGSIERARRVTSRSEQDHTYVPVHHSRGSRARWPSAFSSSAAHGSNRCKVRPIRRYREASVINPYRHASRARRAALKETPRCRRAS